jgi:ribosome recycling factor
LTPQGPTETDPTTLVISVPPPTGESRQAALDSATKISNAALEQIRDARAGKNKKLRAMQIAKTVNPDQIQKAQKEMEQIVQRFSSDVKQILETHKKIISR